MTIDYSPVRTTVSPTGATYYEALDGWYVVEFPGRPGYFLSGPSPTTGETVFATADAGGYLHEGTKPLAGHVSASALGLLDYLAQRPAVQGVVRRFCVRHYDHDGDIWEVNSLLDRSGRAWFRNRYREERALDRVAYEDPKSSKARNDSKWIILTEWFDGQAPRHLYT